ncbi:ABC transporter permease [Myxococcaceae bacterium GXIMD 01537]
MNVLALLGAEWLKASKRPMHRLLLALVGATGLAFCLFMALRAAAEPAARESARNLLPWPFILDSAVEALRVFGRLAAIILAASIVGSEYGHDTWKMLLPRRPGRGVFLGAKLAVTLGALALGVAVVTASYVIPGVVSSKLLGLVPTAPGRLDLTGGRYLSLFLEVAFYASATLLTTVITRSSFGGILLGMAVMIFLGVTGDAEPWLARALPSAHLLNLQARLTEDTRMLALSQRSLGGEVSTGTSVAVWAIYVSAFVGTSLALFKHRDLAGSTGG